VPDNLQGKPSPNGVWVSVSLHELTPDRAQRICRQLLDLHDWSSYFTGANRVAFRYDYQQGEHSRAARTISLLKQAGVTDRAITTFDIWRTTLRLSQSLSEEQATSLSTDLKRMLQVFNVTITADAILHVEFRGEPATGALRQVRRLVKRHTT